MDEDQQVRKAAVWISEMYIKQDDPRILGKLEPLIKDTSADVRFQLSLSLRYSRSPHALEMIEKLIADHPRNEVLTASRKKYEADKRAQRSEEHTSELQSLMSISYAVLCLKKKNN